MKDYNDKSKDLKLPKEGLAQKGNGSMDYLAKQDKMAKEDVQKLKNNAFKDSRY